jgi:hypothetical protein
MLENPSHKGNRVTDLLPKIFDLQGLLLPTWKPTRAAADMLSATNRFKTQTRYTCAKRYSPRSAASFNKPEEAALAQFQSVIRTAP